ncbi:MAG: hypothetical protein RLZZ08_1725, partial [Pseudomonadota bacterium]
MGKSTGGAPRLIDVLENAGSYEPKF